MNTRNTDWIITPAILRELISYDPQTGSMTWKRRDDRWFKDENPHVAKRWNGRFAGRPALAGPAGEYLGGPVFNKTMAAHRVAWAIHHGSWPKMIDHINGDGRDNRLCNLRDVLPEANARNRKLTKRNTSGVPGVRWEAKAGSWVVTIGAKATRQYLGSFKSLSEAAGCRRDAEARLGYHPNNGRRSAVA